MEYLVYIVFFLAGLLVLAVAINDDNRPML